MRLNDIGIYRKGPFGSSLTKSMFVPKGADTVKVYEQKNAIKKDHTLGDYYITRQYYEDKMQGFTVSAGDIIVSCAGTIGETYVMPDNIELGILSYVKMLSKNYFGKGLTTPASIGRVYCPTTNEYGNRIASPHWINLVNTAKSKYSTYDKNISIDDILNY